MLNPTQEEIRVMAREYHAEYQMNGGDVNEAIGTVLRKNKIPESIKGSVADSIMNYRSVTVICITQPAKVVTFKKRLAGVRRTFADMSTPNGDRD